jgi:HEAT repeat protein
MSVRLALIPLAAALAAPAAAGPQAVPGNQPAAAREKTPQALAERLDRAIAARNLETALYAYSSLYHVTGVEDGTRLAALARLVLDEEMRRGAGWLRISAAEVLARRGDEAAVEVLRAAIDDDDLDPSHRSQAIRVLAELEKRDVIPALQKLVEERSPSADERFAAADALLAFGDLGGVPFLVRALHGGDPAEKSRAIAIVSNRRVHVLEPLREAARGEDAALALEAQCALARLGDEQARAALREVLGENPSADVPVVIAEPQEGETEPVEYLIYIDLNRRVLAADVLVEAGDRRAVDFYVDVIRNSQADANYNAVALAQAIEKVDPDLGLRLYEEIFRRRPAGYIQVYAARELAGRGRADGAAEMLAGLYEQSLGPEGDEALRILVLRTLADARIPGGEAILRRALAGDPSDIHRIEAARGLAAAGDAAALHALRGFLESVNRLDAIQAAAALLRAGDPRGTT